MAASPAQPRKSRQQWFIGRWLVAFLAAALLGDAVCGQTPAPTNDAAAGLQSHQQRYETLLAEAERANNQGDWRTAVARLQDALTAAAQEVGADHPTQLDLRDKISRLLEENGAFAESVDVRREAAELASKLFAATPWKAAYARAALVHAEKMAALSAADLKKFSDGYGPLGEMIAHWKAGEYQAAIDVGVPAVQDRFALLGEDDPEAVRLMFLLGRIVFDAREFETAAAIYAQALGMTAAIYGEVHPETATAHSWLGKAYGEAGQLPKSLENHVQALKIARQVLAAEDPALVEALEYAAHAYEASGDPRRALALFEESLELTEQAAGKASVAYAQTLNNCAAALAGVYRTDAAVARYRESLEILKSLPEDQAERDLTLAVTLNNYGSLLRETGAITDARAVLQEAATFCEQRRGQGLEEAIPAILNQLAHVDADLADWDAAFRRQDEAWSRARALWGDEHPSVVTIQHDQGVLLWNIGRLAEARTVLESTLRRRIDSLGISHPDVARNLAELAILCSDLGDLEHAVEYVNLAVPVAREGSDDDSPTLAFCYQNAALLMDTLDQDLPKAVELMEKSLAIRRQSFGEEHAEVAQALSNLSLLYESVGRMDDAMEARQAALAIDEKIYGVDSINTLTVRYNLGAACRNRGDYKAAIAHFDKAAQLAGRSLAPTHPHLAAAIVQRAACEAHLGRLAEAKRDFLQAISLRAETFDQELPLMSASEMAAFTQTVQGELDAVLSLPEGALTAAEVADCILQSKGRTIEALCRLRAVEGATAADPEVAAAAAEARVIRNSISRLALEPPADTSPEDLAQMTATLQRNLQIAERRVNIQLAAHIGASPAPTTANVAAAMPTDAALVEFVAYMPTDYSADRSSASPEARYAAVVVFGDPQRAPVRLDLGPAAPIESAVDAVVGQIEDARRWLRVATGGPDRATLEEAYRRSAAELSTLVVAPLLDAIGDARLVVASPAGKLQSVAFEALLDTEGRYLVDAGYRFAYVTTGRDLLAPRAAPGRGTAIFADPNYELAVADRPASEIAKPDATPPRMAVAGAPDTRGLKWRSLPGFRREGQVAATALDRGDFAPVTSYLGDSAREETLKSLRDCRALVIVTHGYFLERHKSTDAPAAPRLPPATLDPQRGAAAQGLGRLRRADDPLLRTGIVLSGANRSVAAQTTRDASPQQIEPASGDDGWVTASEIAGFDLRGVELVVLSACNTGREVASGGDAIAGLRTAFLAAGARNVVGSLYEVPDGETATLMERFYQQVASGVTPVDALAAAERESIQRLRATGSPAHPFFWASFVVAGRP